jgi:hypothetical protein
MFFKKVNGLFIFTFGVCSLVIYIFKAPSQRPGTEKPLGFVEMQVCVT